MIFNLKHGDKKRGKGKETGKLRAQIWWRFEKVGVRLVTPLDEVMKGGKKITRVKSAASIWHCILSIDVADHTQPRTASGNT